MDQRRLNGAVGAIRGVHTHGLGRGKGNADEGDARDECDRSAEPSDRSGRLRAGVLGVHDDGMGPARKLIDRLAGVLERTTHQG